MGNDTPTPSGFNSLARSIPGLDATLSAAVAKLTAGSSPLALADAGKVRERAAEAFGRASKRGSAGELATAAADAQATESTATPFEVKLYGKLTPGRVKVFSHVNPVDAIREALEYRTCADTEPLLKVEDTDAAAFLDVDWHYPDPAHRLTNEQAAELEKRLPIRPRVWWRTHGGGFRGVYVATPFLTAGEQVAMVVAWVRHEPQRVSGGWTRIERVPTETAFKDITFHPMYERAGGVMCGQVCIWGEPTVPAHVEVITGPILGTVVGVSDDERDAYLEESELQIGQSYPHSRCPIDPFHASHEKPVFVGDFGIECKSCLSYGKTCDGGTRPGWVPWARLVHPDKLIRRENLTLNAVRHFAHWTHAQHVLRHTLGVVGREGRHLYAALVKLYHRDKPAPEVVDQLTRMMFLNIPAVRIAGGWAWADDVSTRIDDKGLSLVNSMPAALHPTHSARKKQWELKPDGIKSSRLKSNGCVADLGYPTVDPLIGIDLLRRIGQEGGAARSVPMLVEADPPFAYRRPAERDRLANSPIWWDVLERNFPGHNRPLLKLLIAAKAFAQKGGSEPIRIFISGQSGAAKSTHVRLAAELCGERSRVPMLSVDENDERFRRMYSELSLSASFILTDEIKKAKRPAREQVSVLLSLTSSTQVHALYKGKVSFGRPAVHTLCDTAPPDEFRTEVQIARRLIHAPLGAGIQGGANKVDWEATCDGGDVFGWRARMGGKYAEYADALVSEVMDEVRTHIQRGGNFKQYAATLGFFPLNNDGAADADSDPNADAVELFKVVITHPEHPGCSRWRGNVGWRVFEKAGATPLATAYAALVGGDRDEQAIDGRQWGHVLQAPGMECDREQHGQKIAVRFRVGKVRTKGVKYNRDALPESHTLQAWQLDTPADTVPFKLPPSTADTTGSPAGSAVASSSSRQSRDTLAPEVATAE